MKKKQGEKKIDKIFNGNAATQFSFVKKNVISN